MTDIQDAFKKAGINPPADKTIKGGPKNYHSGKRDSSQQPNRYQKKNGNSKEKVYQRNIEVAFGKDYTRLILGFKKDEYNELVNTIKRYVEQNTKEITTSQLRNMWSAIKKADDFELMLLRPKLAYVAGRAEKSNKKTPELIFLLDKLIEEIKTEAQVNNFKLFFEAIIAYHKYFGGK